MLGGWAARPLHASGAGAGGAAPPPPPISARIHLPCRPPRPVRPFTSRFASSLLSGAILDACIRDLTHRQLDERGCSAALQAMDCTTKRLKISDVVCNMFRSVLALSPGATVPLKALRPGCVGCIPRRGVSCSWGGSGTRPLMRALVFRFHHCGFHNTLS